MEAIHKEYPITQAIRDAVRMNRNQRALATELVWIELYHMDYNGQDLEFGTALADAQLWDTAEYIVQYLLGINV